MKVNVLLFAVFFSFSCHAACEKPAPVVKPGDEFCDLRRTIPIFAKDHDNRVKAYNIPLSVLNRFYYFDQSRNRKFDVCFVPYSYLQKALNIPVLEAQEPLTQADWDVLILAARLGIKNEVIAYQALGYLAKRSQDERHAKRDHPHCQLCTYMNLIGDDLAKEKEQRDKGEAFDKSSILAKKRYLLNVGPDNF